MKKELLQISKYEKFRVSKKVVVKNSLKKVVPKTKGNAIDIRV